VKRLAPLVLLVGLAGCASAPRPGSLNDARAASTAPAVVQAKAHAPQAFARAEELRRRAEAAYDDGRHADAELLGEHALAAFQRAVIAGRLATVETRAAAAEAELAERSRELTGLDEQNRRALSDAETLELRLKVVREILPVPGSEPATPERERARLEAARAFGLEARLLCLAARMLEPGRETLKERFVKLDALDQRLRGAALPAPIDEARAERTSCLRELTLTRRPVTNKAPATAHADTLLAELSGTGAAPSRDDRGVVVTLRDVFASAKGDLSAAAREKLASLGRVAKAHPSFPILVVAHSSKGGAAERDGTRAQAAAKVLTEQGAGRVEALGAGAAQPLLDPSQAGASARNERLEVVFVAPASL
jgi:outer membrane protein OmpA-like peptidoglycan-associated protein